MSGQYGDPGTDPSRVEHFGPADAFSRKFGDDQSAPVSSKMRQGGRLDAHSVRVAGDPAQGGTGPTLVSERNPRRIALWLFNNSNSAMAVGGSMATTFSQDGPDAGFILPSNSAMVIDDTYDAVYVCWNGGAGTAQLRVAEITE